MDSAPGSQGLLAAAETWNVSLRPKSSQVSVQVASAYLLRLDEACAKTHIHNSHARVRQETCHRPVLSSGDQQRLPVNVLLFPDRLGE
jgi:hypothetical protein